MSREIIKIIENNCGMQDSAILIEYINNKEKEIERLNKCIKDDKENANEIMAEQQREIERLREENDIAKEKVKSATKEIERLNNIINELEKCVQNYIYAIEPRGCSINYNCEYDSEEDYINAMKEQSKLNAFKFILDKIKELKGSDKE